MIGKKKDMTYKPTEEEVQGKLITYGLAKGEQTKAAEIKRAQAWAKRLIEARDVPDRGRGLFALASFSEGEVICPLDGEWVARREDVPEFARSYAIWSPKDGTLVPDIASTGWHVINHSCKPNCYYDADSITLGRDHALVRAQRRIEKGEEIVSCYVWLVTKGREPDYEEKMQERCFCASPHCTGWMYINVPGVEWLPDGRIEFTTKMNDYGRLREWERVLRLNLPERQARIIVHATFQKIFQAYPLIAQQGQDYVNWVLRDGGKPELGEE